MQNIHDKFMILREVKLLVAKYYRHPYFCKLNSADKKTQFFKKRYFKSYYFRYSHVLCTITTLEKSERFDLLSMILYKRGTPLLTFFNGYSTFFRTGYFTKQFQTTDFKGFLFA